MSSNPGKAFIEVISERQQKRKQWRFLFWFFGLILSMLCWNRSCSYLWYTASLQRQHWWKNDFFPDMQSLSVYADRLLVLFHLNISRWNIGATTAILPFPPFSFSAFWCINFNVFFVFFSPPPVSLLLSHIINANRGAFADDTTNIGFIVVMLLCIPPPFLGLLQH